MGLLAVGVATAASFASRSSVSVDAAGNLHATEQNDRWIRRVPAGAVHLADATDVSDRARLRRHLSCAGVALP